MQSLEVEIFGRLFRLRSDDPTRTKKVAADLSRQLTELYETYENLDFSRLLLLACFKQQEQLQQVLDENTQLKAELDRVNLMIEKMFSV